MRNIFLLCCVALAGLCACESEEKVYPDGPGLNEDRADRPGAERSLEPGIPQLPWRRIYERHPRHVP